MLTLQRDSSGVMIDLGKTMFFEEIIRVGAAERPVLIALINRLASGRRADHLAAIEYCVNAFGTGIIYQEVHQ